MEDRNAQGMAAAAAALRRALLQWWRLQTCCLRREHEVVRPLAWLCWLALRWQRLLQTSLRSSLGLGCPCPGPPCGACACCIGSWPQQPRHHHPQWEQALVQLVLVPQALLVVPLLLLVPLLLGMCFSALLLHLLAGRGR